MNPRKRSSNFSTAEELLLLREVDKFKAIIENKATNNITTGEKNEAWVKILHNFNSKNVEFRTLEQLKTKFDNLRTKARKWAAYRSGTNPGPVIEAVLNIINYKSASGISFISTDDSGCVDNNHFRITDVKSNYPPENHNNDNMLVEVKCENLDDSLECINQANKRSASSEIEFSDSQHSHWSAKRSRVQNPVCTAKEDYYRKKAELLQLEIDYIKRKQASEESALEEELKQKIRRDKREEERHRKEMLLLDLKIETLIAGKSS